MKTKTFDLKTKGVKIGRVRQTGTKDASYYKNVCVACGLAFNRTKGRPRSLSVTLASGQRAYLCSHCDTNGVTVETFRK